MGLHSDTDSLIEIGAFDNLPLSSAENEPDEKVREYLAASTSKATLKAYKSDLKHFKAWGGTIPATVQLIASYIAAHANALSVATLERRLAALSKIHQTLGVENPTRSDLVRTTMRGIRRKMGTSQRQVAPITKERLLAMLSVCDDGVRGLRDKALLLVGFAGAFRRSELVALNCKHIEFVPEGIIITIERSKTDQEGKGRRLGVPFTKGEICPVNALQQYIQLTGITGGPIFRPMADNGKLGITQLTPASVALIIKQRAKQAGMDPTHFSGHSLRAGFATSAAQAGAETWAIMKQTGHKSEKTIRRYIREGEFFNANPLSSVL